MSLCSFICSVFLVCSKRNTAYLPALQVWTTEHPHAQRDVRWTIKKKKGIKKSINANGPVAQLDKASDYESGDSRFESWQGHFFL